MICFMSRYTELNCLRFYGNHPPTIPIHQHLETRLRAGAAQAAADFAGIGALPTGWGTADFV